jgi:cytochrome c biogenesis protein
MIDISIFSSLKLFFVLIALVGTTILIGSWCPQEAQVGKEKVIEQFGPDLGARMIQYGISDIFHTPFFLGLIGLLSINLICASCTRVFPKVKLLKQPMPMLGPNEINKMVTHHSVDVKVEPTNAISALAARLKKAGYKVDVQGSQLTAHWGKWGRLAATVTHIGLLTLLLGVTITSWTGFNGFEPILLHRSLEFAEAQHSKMWVGSLPKWTVRVDETHREDYPNGDPKQWYSTLSVLDPAGKVLKTQQISVNNPLSYDGVDIYQSSWGLHGINVLFNGHKQFLQLQQMGRVHAAVMPLDEKTIMLFSIRDPKQPIRLFAKIPEWPQPKLLQLLKKGEPAKLGGVTVTYDELVPATGLQYKSDPGLPITYLAFAFIMIGVSMATIPYRQVWAAAGQTERGTELVVGGTSRKAKNAFERSLTKLVDSVLTDVGSAEPCRGDGADSAKPSPCASPVEEATVCPTSK